MSQKKDQQTQHEKEKTFDPGVSSIYPFPPMYVLGPCGCFQELDPEHIYEGLGQHHKDQHHKDQHHKEEHPKEPSGETLNKHENQTEINNIRQPPIDEEKDCSKNSNNNKRFDNFYNNYNIDWHSPSGNGETSQKQECQTGTNVCQDPVKEQHIEEKKDCVKSAPDFGRFDNFYNNYNINWHIASAGVSRDAEEGDDKPS